MSSSLQESIVDEVDLPVIDFSQFPQEFDEGGLNRLKNHPLLATVREACKEWGFFRIVDHGVPLHLLENVLSVSRDLFAMPTEAKDRATTCKPLESYFRSPVGRSLFLETFAILDSPYSASAQEIARKIWPKQEKSNLCETVGAYASHMSDLVPKIMKIILATLDLDVHSFYQSDFEKCGSYLRLNYYKFVGEGAENMGFPSHADPVCLTILYNDDKEGLEIRSKQGKWFSVKPQSYSIIVNVGDTLRAWTNGKYYSSEHRVACKGWRDRISLAHFYHFQEEKKIWVLAELVSEINPRQYKPFLYSQFRKGFKDIPMDTVKTTFLDHFTGI